jgi:hypothetical protein
MPARTKKAGGYRTCVCGHTWKTREKFLADRNVTIVGYQPDFVNHKYNHFLFKHRAKGCGEFFGVRASDFNDLREAGCPSGLCFGKEPCPGYCKETGNLRVCSVTCRNASDRIVASKIRRRRALIEFGKVVAGGRRKAAGKRTAARID